MDDPFVVRVLERLADLGDDRQRLARLELAACQQLPQVHAIDVLHEEVVQAAGLAEVVQGDDVRVIEPGQGAGLAGESLREPGDASDMVGRILRATRRSIRRWRAL